MKDSPGIQVWHARSSSSEPGTLEQSCENWLSPDERVRADQFRIATSRNQHVVGRGMARRLLGREQIDPCRITFAIEKNGKPYVSQPAEARRPFNIAHTMDISASKDRCHVMRGRIKCLTRNMPYGFWVAGRGRK